MGTLSGHMDAVYRMIPVPRIVAPVEEDVAMELSDGKEGFRAWGTGGHLPWKLVKCIRLHHYISFDFSFLFFFNIMCSLFLVSIVSTNMFTIRIACLS